MFVPVGDDGRTSFAEFNAWLLEREEAALVELGDAAERIALAHLERYVESLTAAGDVAALDGMAAEWRMVLDDFIGVTLSETYLAGAVQAYSSVPGGLAPSLLPAWTEVVNEAAVAYQAKATNRLVGVGDDIWQEVREASVDRLRAGVEIPELRKEIEDIAGVSRSRAAAVARTETLGAYNGGDLDGAVALGDAGPVAKRWLSTSDGRTRETHAAADGQVVPFGEPFIVGGVEMARPLDPAGPASEVVNCRCVMLMFFEGDEEANLAR